jgi:hypothetical protein
MDLGEPANPFLAPFQGREYVLFPGLFYAETVIDCCSGVFHLESDEPGVANLARVDINNVHDSVLLCCCDICNVHSSFTLVKYPAKFIFMGHAYA